MGEVALWDASGPNGATAQLVLWGQSAVNVPFEKACRDPHEGRPGEGMAGREGRRTRASCRPWTRAPTPPLRT